MRHLPLNSRLRKHQWITLGVLLCTFAGVYRHTLSLLIETWTTRSDYSHGFLIPIISAYLIWVKRDQLQGILLKPHVPGGLLLLSGANILMIMGDVSATIVVQLFSLVLVIPGVVLLLLGTQYLRALALPLSYLLFMVPIFDIIIDKIQISFQLVSAAIASFLLKLFQIPVLHHEQFLELPNMTLEVAGECSGVHFLISIVALAIPLAVLTLKGRFPKILLVGIAVVVAILSNALRVALIGVWVYTGHTDIHGPGHLLHGVFVSVVGYIFLFLIAWVIKNSLNTRHPESSVRKKTEYAAIKFMDDRAFYTASIITFAMFIAYWSYSSFYQIQPIPLKRDLSSLSQTIGQWNTLENTNQNTTFFQAQGANIELRRSYQNNDGHIINIYIGYFEQQREGSKMIHYSLHRLYENVKKRDITVNTGEVITVGNNLVRDSQKTWNAMYWYNLNDTLTADNNSAKLKTAFDGILHRRTNGAVIMVYGVMDTTGHVSNNDHTYEYLQDFIRVATPEINRLLSPT